MTHPIAPGGVGVRAGVEGLRGERLRAQREHRRNHLTYGRQPLGSGGVKTGHRDELQDWIDGWLSS